MDIKPILSGSIKIAVRSKAIYLACNYAGCGSDDSWPRIQV